MRSRMRIIHLEMIPIARWWIWRVDEVNGVRLQPRLADPSPCLGREREEAHESLIVGRLSRCSQRSEGRRIGCLRATRSFARSRNRGQERTVHAGRTDMPSSLLVSRIADVTAAARRRDLGQQQRDDDRQEGQMALPADSVERTRPLGKHGIDSGVARNRTYRFYRRYARYASKVRSRIEFRLPELTGCNGGLPPLSSLSRSVA